MGVVSIHQYPVPEGKSGQQVVEELEGRLEKLGSKKTDTFTVDCEFYYSATHITPSRTINLLHNTEFPASIFAILDTGTCLVADTTFDSFLQKLSGIYTSKKSTKIESKGTRFELVDFVIKIGSVSIGPSFKGILVEVEYSPCAVPGDCWDLMKEFMQGFLGRVVQSPPQYLQGRMNEEYTAVDTAQQYLEYFNSFRRAPASAR